MKNRTLVIVSLLLSFSFILNAQNAKRSTQSFKYEYMPFYPQPAEYKSFRVVLESKANDRIPLDARKLYYKNMFFAGFRNVTEARAKDQGGIFIGGNKAVNPELELVNPNVDSDFEITMSFGDIELTDKSVLSSYPEGYKLQPGEINHWNFKLSFNFPYHLKVFDRRKNQVVFDSLINNPRVLYYPKSYREGFLGHTNKPDLDLDYKKNGGDIYYLSKGALIAPCIGESNSVLRYSIGYFRDGFSMGITRVKSKKPIFDICDTASNILELISDSISYNSKNDKHINWHTNGLKLKAAKLEAIWNDMLTNELYISEFKDVSEKAEYLKGIRMNKAYALLLQDKFDDALINLNEVSPEITQNGGAVNYDQMDSRALRALIKREKYLYVKHKAYYNFN